MAKDFKEFFQSQNSIKIQSVSSFSGLVKVNTVSNLKTTYTCFIASRVFAINSLFPQKICFSTIVRKMSFNTLLAVRKESIFLTVRKIIYPSIEETKITYKK